VPEYVAIGQGDDRACDGHNARADRHSQRSRRRGSLDGQEVLLVGPWRSVRPAEGCKLPLAAWMRRRCMAPASITRCALRTSPNTTDRSTPKVRCTFV